MNQRTASLLGFTQSKLWRALVLGTALLGSSAAMAIPAVNTVPTPESVLGFAPGADYKLANYEESLQYFHALANSSDHIQMVSAGTSSGGRPMEYAVISTPDNLAQWEHYKEVSRRLADARGLDDKQANELARDSKIIVHIDGGMHSSEAADHQLPLALVHSLVAGQGDPEIDFILDNVIVVLWPTLNPDGQTMISDWYRQNVGTAHETSPMPWLYQKYVGHDNNRDGYMLNMQESQVVTAAQRDYAPAIWYSQHQKAPFPARIWVPPFSDPVSSNINPLMRHWTSLIGMHMIADFEQQGLPGAIAQARFDNWYPGFLDYTHVFRHTISYFTETALHAYATPFEYKPENFPEEFKDMKAQIMYTTPWRGGWWRLADAVNYMEVASLSTLKTAARYRESLLYNRYQAGRDTMARFASEGPYAYVIPSAQRDLPTAVLLLEKLQANGIEISQVKRKTRFGDVTAPADSWVIRMDQPFAGLVQELFETQSYPDAFLNHKGEPANLPYDTTGWTLPLQMGVDVVAVKEPLSKRNLQRLEVVQEPLVASAGISGRGDVFLLKQSENASYKTLNAAIAAGASAQFTRHNDEDVIALSGISRESLLPIAQRYQSRVEATTKSVEGVPVRADRVGMYRPWKPSMDEGWTRWILEDYGYPLTSLYNEDLHAGNLKDKVDVLILPDISLGWLMEGFDEKPSESWMTRNGGADTDPVPVKYAGGINGQGAQALRDFVAGGGKLVAFNSAASAAIDVLGLPVKNVLEGAGSDEFYCSGALLQLQLADTDNSVIRGLAESPVAMFTHGPVFTPAAGFEGEIIASYPEQESPLKSGVLLHPEAIQSKAAAVEVNYGKGHVYLYGFRPQWRGQSHGTYKFVFNTLYSSIAM